MLGDLYIALLVTASKSDGVCTWKITLVNTFPSAMQQMLCVWATEETGLDMALTRHEVLIV